jgi:hypothetical protein
LSEEKGKVTLVDPTTNRLRKFIVKLMEMKFRMQKYPRSLMESVRVIED